MIYGSKAPTRSKGVSFLSVALAMAGIGCSDASNNPNGISTGGSSAGRGGRGGTSSAGQGGTSDGGSAGAGAIADAGNEGGAAGGSMGGSSGSGRPEGCPEPTPIPKPTQSIVVQSVNIRTSEIILRNAASTPASIALGRAAWQWCVYPRYWSLSDVDTTVELAPGETYSFIPVNNQSEVPEFYVEEGELAIYSQAQDFNDFETMESFVAWGEGQAFRESYAVQRGVWTFDERVQIASGHAGFIATGEVDRASGYTSAPARCLVP